MIGELQSFWRKFVLIIQNKQNLYRCMMLDKAMDFVRHNDVIGDYFEFGVYAGATFQYAYHAARDRGLKKMKFHALDSFEGFSEPKGNDNIGLISEGSRNCSEEQFLFNVQKSGVPLSAITTTKGWFSNTLGGDGKQDTDKKFGNTKISVVWLDADLYEPTVSALEYLTPRLQDGSVMIFDNWFLFKGHPGRGERRAFAQWQQKNPEIIVTPFYNFSWHGTSFIINLPIAENQEGSI